jgi:tripartite-type tricarboxylate transporter receptor subunit TctC
MKQQVVVDNRPGASTIIGLEALKRASPDGYTFGYVTTSIASNPSLFAKLPYDWQRDFRAVILQGRGYNVLAAAPSLPVHSVKDLIEHARANPDKLKFGDSGVGGPANLSMQLFKTMTNTAMMYIPYKAQQQVVMDVVAGQIDVQFDAIAFMLPYVRSGRVRGLAVTSLNRLDVLSELPTVHESGVPGYEFSGWSGYAVPVGVARNHIERLNSEINKALSSPAVSKAYASRGSVTAGGTPEEFADHVRKETEKFGKLIKAAGIKPQ